MEPRIFNVPSFHFDYLLQLVEKLNKKAKRAGTAPFSFTKLSETTEIQPNGAVDVFYQVAVQGETPKIAGWTFVARLDHNSDPSGDSNFVYVMPGQSLPSQYYDAGADCEHCGYIRKRRDTYILKNDESGEFKQVGRTCVQDFTGIDPEKVLAQAERIAKLMKAAADAEKGELDVPYNRRCYDLLTFMAVVQQEIREHGWKSRSEAFQNGTHDATADHAVNRMFSSGYWGTDYVPTAEDWDKAMMALQYASTLDPQVSSYNHNVVTMVKTGYIDWKAAGIAASIARIYDNWVEKKAKEASNNFDGSEYIGEVGKRINGRVRIVRKTLKDTDYGVMKIYQMASINGNNLIVSFVKGQNFNPNVGDELEIRATVSKHQIYNGVKQTIVKRAAVA